MITHNIDSDTVAITGGGPEQRNGHTWLRILRGLPGAILITGEDAVRNLRDACNVALREIYGEKR